MSAACKNENINAYPPQYNKTSGSEASRLAGLKILNTNKSVNLTFLGIYHDCNDNASRPLQKAPFGTVFQLGTIFVPLHKTIFSTKPAKWQTGKKTILSRKTQNRFLWV
jgi:hypothetical protein